MTAPPPLLLHATCVAVDGRGLLIMGPSGSGKSLLAIQMMALGARLVADDQVHLSLQNGVLTARCPAALSGLIEARGLGLLHAKPLPEAPVHLAVELGQSDPSRLPDHHGIVFLDQRIDLVRAAPSAHLPAALLLYLRGGRVA